jgi:phage I-like protein
MIEPKGLHPNKRAGVVQVIDEEAAVSIVNRFKEASSAPDFAGMLIDHEHFKHQADQETRAFGWLMALENRKDGIYAQIRWTTTGKAAVDGGDYRFFSTEYAPDSLDVLNKENPAKVRPMALSGLTVTNDPNNKGGKPITNREAPEQFRQTVETAAATPETKTPHMTKTNTLLGLAADASDDAAAAEVSKIINRATAAETEVAALKTTNTEMTVKVKTFEDAAKAFAEKQADADLEPIKNRATPEILANLKAQLLTNRDATLEIVKMIAAQPVVTAPAPGPVLNRAETEAKAPDLTKAEDKTFQGLVNRAMTDQKLSKSTAIDVVMKSDPEAYKEWLKTGGLI